MTSSGRAGRQARLLGVLDDPGVDALDQRVGQPLPDRPLAPGQVLGRPVHAGLPAYRVAISSSRSVASARRFEHDVLDALPQLRLDVVVHRQHAGIDDGHVQPGPLGVVQEDRVDRLADPVVAAERERHVRHAAGRARAGQLGLEPPHGLDERDGVGVVLLDAGRDGEDVGVEDDVLGREADLLGQQLVGARRGSPPGARRCRAWPCSSNAMTTTAAP